MVGGLSCPQREERLPLQFRGWSEGLIVTRKFPHGLRGTFLRKTPIHIQSVLEDILTRSWIFCHKIKTSGKRVSSVVDKEEGNSWGWATGLMV